MKTRDDIQLIDEYLNGELSPELCAGIENRLKTDKEFATTFKVVNDLNEFLRNKKVTEFNLKLQEIKLNLALNKNHKKNK